MKEHPIMQRVMLAVSAIGGKIFRNNVGVVEAADGRYIRFGLCKGSSDLVGWTPVKVKPEDVGSPVAVFTALEVKMPGKHMTDEQRRFVDAVRADGGIAAEIHSGEEAERIVGERMGHD